MIAVDSSVWIALLRDDDTAALRELERQLHGPEEIVVPDVVLTEVLRGCPSETRAAVVSRELARFRVLRLTTIADFRRAAALYRTARRAGFTIRSTVDCLIASMCVRDDVRLLHANADFDRLASVSALRIVPLS